VTDIDVREYATAVARYGLSGAEGPAPLEGNAWSLALATLAEQKVIGIAMAAADDGWLPVGDEQYAQLAHRERNAMAWCLELERRLLEIADVFGDEGIEFVVLKGPALAHTVYPDPSWRTFNDLDLLVRTSQWEKTCDVLEKRFGWPRRLPEPRPGFDVRFGKGAVFTTESGQQVDLHRNLAQGPFGVWIRPDELFGRTAEFTIAHATVQRLDASAAFVHACIHAVLGDARPNLVQLRDVVQTQRAPLDTAWLARVSDEWRIGPVIARATDAARRLDPGARDDVAAVSKDTSSWALAAYELGRRGRLRMHLAMVRAIPGVEQKARYVRDLAVPRQEFTLARGRGRWPRPLASVMPGSIRGRTG
jgi:hypothetical protein